MNRIDEKILNIKNEGRYAIAASIVAGDGGVDFSRAAVLKMVESDADFVIIGVPFSDPSAESITVQASHMRAMDKGINIFKTFDMIEKLRETVKEPIILSLYYNVIVRYGVERFFKECREKGIDGLIIFDLPYEEYSDISEFSEKYEVYQIHIVTGLNKERARIISRDAKGFLFGIGVDDKMDITIPVYALDSAVGDGIIVKEEIAKILDTDIEDSKKTEKIAEVIKNIKSQN